MDAVARLVTLVDARDEGGDATQMSFSTRHEAVLVDGRRVPLLNDRGWSFSPVYPGEALEAASRQDNMTVSAMTGVKEIEKTARVVVGPDEPFGERSLKEMEADHWAFLAGILGQHGIDVDPVDLMRLPHEVVLSEQLLVRLSSPKWNDVL
jgi:hypothetical protein